MSNTTLDSAISCLREAHAEKIRASKQVFYNDRNGYNGMHTIYLPKHIELEVKWSNTATQIIMTVWDAAPESVMRGRIEQALQDITERRYSVAIDRLLTAKNVWTPNVNYSHDSRPPFTIGDMS